jgi:hypothetical protein
VGLKKTEGFKNDFKSQEVVGQLPGKPGYYSLFCKLNQSIPGSSCFASCNYMKAYGAYMPAYDSICTHARDMDRELIERESYESHTERHTVREFVWIRVPPQIV